MTFDISSARKAIAKLEAEGIPFKIKQRDSGVRNMPVAPLPTKYGLGAKVSIRVAPQYDDAFEVICKAVMTPSEDWEVVGRVYPPGFIMGTQAWFKKLFGIEKKQNKSEMSTPRKPSD
jgi:hypothetical protein